MKKWLNRLEDALKRLAGKAADPLLPIVASVGGAISNFVANALGFVAKQTWALIVFCCWVCWGMVDAENIRVSKKKKGMQKKENYKSEKEKRAKKVLG